MSPESAAVVSQVMPIMYIAAFVGTHRATRDRPIHFTQKIVFAAALLSTPILEMLVLDHVMREAEMPGWLATTTFFCLMLLSLSMFAAALTGLAPDVDGKDKTPEAKSDPAD